jgi:DNA-binding NarL/FixJ family response regulator
MALQAACTIFFVFDIIQDYAALPSGQIVSLHLSIELAANLGLVAALFVEWRVLHALLARQKATEKTIAVAAGSLHDVIEGYFAEWGLTPAEADVAHFTIKGFSVAEVAQMRRSSDGTVKSQLNAIYRKSGLTGRAQLVSLLIEDLLHAPAVPETPAVRVPAGSPLAV